MMSKLEYHEAFTQPSDPTILAWRYMDLAKFLSLLLKRELYLRRLDLMPDKYEGFYPRHVPTVLAQHYASDGVSEEEAVRFANHQVDFAKTTRRMMFINCWHLGNHESEAMWRIYCGDNGGLAIVLPYEQLRASLPAGLAWIGEVRYLDYENDVLIPGNAFRVALHKRREFLYEQEARIVSFGTPSTANTPADLPSAFSFAWDIDLIKNVVVNPYAPKWYVETVREIVECLVPHLFPRVMHSAMAAEPG